MLPIGPLMKEHRLIERMIKLIKIELSRINKTKKADPNFIEVTIDFLRTYADRCHHGKEENILFRDLGKKKLSDEHSKIMNELVEEHVYARRTVRNLETTKESYVKGNIEPLKDILKLLNELVEFYPMHIEKEDKHFFIPCMEYFTTQEQDDMTQEFWEFDRKMIHEKYQKIVDKIEQPQYKDLAKWRCLVCDYVYDPEKGDPENGIPHKTTFEELPENWACPICGASKTEFEKITAEDKH